MTHDFLVFISLLIHTRLLVMIEEHAIFEDEKENLLLSLIQKNMNLILFCFSLLYFKVLFYNCNVIYAHF